MIRSFKSSADSRERTQSISEYFLDSTASLGGLISLGLVIASRPADQRSADPKKGKGGYFHRITNPATEYGGILIVRLRELCFAFGFSVSDGLAGSLAKEAI